MAQTTTPWQPCIRHEKLADVTVRAVPIAALTPGRRCARSSAESYPGGGWQQRVEERAASLGQSGCRRNEAVNACGELRALNETRDSLAIAT